ncbi:MAG: molybdopterin-dependent oxidoreductase [Desulfobacteraceae bacterium]|nr:molybdopterin-dependent oxidoreductase [Desulfobacteraceae bacterium]
MKYDINLKRASFRKGFEVLTGGLFSRAGVSEEIVYEGDYEIFRNVCPRNCYDTCGIKTYVKDGVIRFIEGAPESTFTDGGLCVKGYAYPRRVYSPDRIKTPMRQIGRGSGKWQRISWDEAMDIIARKILSLKEQDGSLLGLCLAKASGHHGVTNNSPQGMMSALGYTTRTVGTPCWPAGIDAQAFDMGAMWCNDPEDMINSRYIILWGVNPAWCSIHTMKYIYEAQSRGAKVVVIDPVFTQTAAKADLYFQVRAGTDGALALGMARHILDLGLVDETFVTRHAVGYDRFANYLKDNITVPWAAAACGLPEEDIRRLAEEFASATPATIWIGYGMQRHINGGANVRAIDALGAITGNIGIEGGGVRYGHLTNRIFNYAAADMPPPKDAASSQVTSDRLINTNKLAREIIDAGDPPVRMLWITCRNPMSQDFDRPLLEKAFDSLDLIVSVEQFFTQTVEHSDIVLPVTTLFEEWSINVSYWHYWLSINEQAIAPLHECKSNTQIAAALSTKMNELSPGSCTFPTDLTDEQWIDREFNPELLEMFGISDWRELRNGPVKAKMPAAAWHERRFKTPSGKYEFYSETAATYGHKALPEFSEPRKARAPFRVMTPHSKFAIHSQFQNLDYMADFNPEPHVAIHPEAAAAKQIRDGDPVRIFNDIGELTAPARLTTNVSRDCLVLYEVWFNQNAYCVQNLVDDRSADMGAFQTGAPGVAIHDQFADIERVG